MRYVSKRRSFDNVISSDRKVLGGYSGEVPPLPIPNREVKLTNADGTAVTCGRVGSRLFKPSSFELGFFYYILTGPTSFSVCHPALYMNSP